MRLMFLQPCNITGFHVTSSFSQIIFFVNFNIFVIVFLVHNIYEALESGKEVRSVVLNTSKAFDKVWHAGLLCKLETSEVQKP